MCPINYVLETEQSSDDSTVRLHLCSSKVQKKNYREEKKRATKELLSTITDPSVIVMADWLKVGGSWFLFPVFTRENRMTDGKMSYSSTLSGVCFFSFFRQVNMTFWLIYYVRYKTARVTQHFEQQKYGQSYSFFHLGRNVAWNIAQIRCREVDKNGFLGCFSSSRGVYAPANAFTCTYVIQLQAHWGNNLFLSTLLTEFIFSVGSTSGWHWCRY